MLSDSTASVNLVCISILENIWSMLIPEYIYIYIMLELVPDECKYNDTLVTLLDSNKFVTKC